MHDWLNGFRGGERVLEVFCELFPDAPIYTLVHKKNSTSDIIESKEIITSGLQKMPGAIDGYRKYLPLMPHFASKMKVSNEYDLVLSSSHCVIKAVEKPRNAKHICYIHSPMRYIYDQFDAYFGRSAPLYQRLGAKTFRGYLQKFDQTTNDNVDHFVANSNFVKDRVKKYYDRDADVIHPFVDLDDFAKYAIEPPKKKEHYLVLSAFAPNKKVDLAIKAFNILGKPLRVIGSGQQNEYLRSIAKENITFLGNVSREQVVDELASAKALIFPGVEDFGIVPLESLAACTPLIAYKKGGVLETQDLRTAEFFNEQSTNSLIDAIKRFELKKFEPRVLIARANEFSKDAFKKKIMDYVESH